MILIKLNLYIQNKQCMSIKYHIYILEDYLVKDRAYNKNNKDMKMRVI